MKEINISSDQIQTKEPTSQKFEKAHKVKKK